VACGQRLGSFTRFVSEPLLTGFTAGAGIYIAVNQLPLAVLGGTLVYIGIKLVNVAHVRWLMQTTSKVLTHAPVGGDRTAARAAPAAKARKRMLPGQARCPSASSPSLG
jgi:hypothetical protein